MRSPLVSVVIPIFNQVRFVVETVGSAVRQTYPNLQVIVIDDGSTDGSSELLEREFGDRIALIRQPNSGPSLAVNRGLASARGDFIALLGGDDVCVEDRISIQLDLIEKTAHDIIFSKPVLIDDSSTPLEDDAFPVFYRTMPEDSLLRTLAMEGNFLCASSAFMRREVVEKIGAFHPGLIQLQDYEYWLRALAMGLRLAQFEPRVVRYRRHAENLSSRRGNFASSAEMMPVLRSVLEGGHPTLLRDAFGPLFAPVEDRSKPLSPFDKSLLLLAHPRSEIRMMGLEYATTLFSDEEFMATARKFGLNLVQFVRNAAWDTARAN